jgi:hypothetical protein
MLTADAFGLPLNDMLVNTYRRTMTKKRSCRLNYGT